MKLGSCVALARHAGEAVAAVSAWEQARQAPLLLSALSRILAQEAGVRVAVVVVPLPVSVVNVETGFGSGRLGGIA